MKLTNTACKSAQPKNKQYKRFDGGGLYLLVTPTGSKLWRLKYRYLGTEKVLAIGSYPEVSLNKLHLSVKSKKAYALIRMRLIKAGVKSNLKNATDEAISFLEAGAFIGVSYLNWSGDMIGGSGGFGRLAN